MALENSSDTRKLIAVVGPTACGKTRRAVALARALGGEIVSADSRQVYRGMDIGTGKDLGEYGDVPYHLIDILPAGGKYNLHRFIADATAAVEDIRLRGRRPIMCGGTGLYVESFLSGLTLPEVPENKVLREELSKLPLDELTRRLASMKTLHNVTDVDTPQRAIRAIEIQQWYADHPEVAGGQRRVSLPATIICLDIDREERCRRIDRRLDERLAEGMVDEVKRLIDSGIDPQDLIYYGLEYKFVTLHIIGQMSYDEMRSSLATAIHQFAKRQMTWWRGMERRGFTLHHIPHDLSDTDFLATCLRLLASN